MLVDDKRENFEGCTFQEITGSITGIKPKRFYKGEKNQRNIVYQEINHCSKPLEEHDRFIWCFREDGKLVLGKKNMWAGLGRGKTFVALLKNLHRDKITEADLKAYQDKFGEATVS